MRSTVEALLPLHSLQPLAFKNHLFCRKLSIFQIVNAFAAFAALAVFAAFAACAALAVFAAFDDFAAFAFAACAAFGFCFSW